MVLGDIHMFVDKQCKYSLINNKLYLYNGTIIDKIINIKIIDKFQISINNKGEVYITLKPIYVNIII